MELIVVGIGSALGALLRYFVTIALKKQSVTFPYATLLINLTGSFLLGFLMGLSISHPMTLFLGTGVLGGYTTFSTMNEELLTLFRKNRNRFLFYFLWSYGMGLLVCFVGIWLGMKRS